MCDIIEFKDIFGTLTDYMYERTNESWRHLENQIARFQCSDNILGYNMVRMIQDYRRSPKDNLFDISIKSDIAAMSCKMSELYDEVKPTKFYKESNYHMVMLYKSVDEITISDIWSVLGYGEDHVKNIVMRGTTFYVTLK